MSRDDDRRRNDRDGSTARLRARLRAIKPEDGDMIALLGVVKGMLDIIDDVGRWDGRRMYSAPPVLKHETQDERIARGHREARFKGETAK
jgi:hypothetical protein